MPHTMTIRKENVILGALLLLLALFAVACSGSGEAPVVESGPYEGTTLDGAAADFTLTDQHGEQVSLSDFRGQVVALTFMDSHCQETCPLTAVHLRDAYQKLPEDVAPVAFLAVNVNVEENDVEDVAAATEAWRLDEIETWHFLTGSEAELAAVWEAYGVGVSPPAEGDGHAHAHIPHTPGVYLIGPGGQLRWYISTPYDESGKSLDSAQLSDLLVKQIEGLHEEA